LRDALDALSEESLGTSTTSVFTVNPRDGEDDTPTVAWHPTAQP
jgi:hypothetical protein